MKELDPMISNLPVFHVQKTNSQFWYVAQLRYI